MIEVQNLTKTFNGKTVLDGISFEVKEGEIFGYLGPNGAGKTTTMRIILRLLKPTSGNALVFGEDLGSYDKLRRRVGILLENDGLYEGLSASENLDYYAQLYGISDGVARKRRIEELLEFVGLSNRKKEKVGTFSKGMKRKLGLVRSMIHNPDILFFDEPSSGLDPEAQRMVRDLILRLSKEEKRTVFLNSHDLDEVQRVCTKIAILQDGAIKAYGTVEHLRRKFSKPIVEITFVDSEESKRALNFISALEYVSECEEENAKIEVTLKGEDTSTLLSTLIGEGIKVEEIKKTSKSLEDVYLDIVQKGRVQNE
jgi:ABC-2 type transport system ATP-binding protein